MPCIPSVILLREKVTLRCDVLGTTYRIRAKHFLCTNFVKYTAAHRPQTTNHISTLNSRIQLTLIFHNLTINTQITTCCIDFPLNASWTLIKYNLILGHMQHLALLSILYVSSTRLPHIAILSTAGNNAALSQSSTPAAMNATAHLSPLTLPRDSIHMTEDKSGYNFRILYTFRSKYPYSFPLRLQVPRHV